MSEMFFAKRLFIVCTILIALVMVNGQNGFSIPEAYSQESGITIDTSADDNGGKFFGEGVVRVVIEDEDADDDSTVEDVIVDIDAEPEDGPGGSGSFAIPETSQASGRFEFYLTHADADKVSPDDIEPANTAGVEGAAGAGPNAAPIITFGSSGSGADIVIAEADLYDEVSFEIKANGATEEIDYDNSEATISLDRQNYGSTSFVYVRISDQDANLNPTVRDSFEFDPDGEPNSDLFAIDGASIEAITFRETGDNTRIFEAKYLLGDTIVATQKLIALTLFDKANYQDNLDAPENDSNGSDEVSFTIGDSGGSMTVNEGQNGTLSSDPVFSSDKPSYAGNDRVIVTIADSDANSDDTAVDTIQVAVASGQTVKQMTALETGGDTGVFELEFSLTDMPISGNNDSVVIRYLDKQPASSASEKEFSYQINVLQTNSLDSTSVSRPALKDVTGRTLSSLAVGQQAVLSTTVVNQNDEPRPFTALVEVRDSDGITVFLAWQTGTLNANGQSEVGLSWTPKIEGNYQLRCFVISDFAEPEILSPVSESSIDVN